MRASRHPIQRWPLAVAVVALLAGCGDSGGGSAAPNEPNNDVPNNDLPNNDAPPEAHALTCAAPGVIAQPLGRAGKPSVVTCAVSATPALELTGLTLNVEGPFAVSPPAETSASPGAELQLEVTFAPEAQGPTQGTLTLSWASGEASGQTTVALEGNGLRALTWDPTPEAPPCRAEGDAPLLDEALALAGLERGTFGFTEADLASSGYHAAGYLDDEFLLPWFFEVRAAPARTGCFEGAVAGGIDHALGQPHPVAGLIRQAATLLDRAPDADEPFHPEALPGDFDAALAAMCEAAGGPCGRQVGELPDDLRQALTPLLWAMTEGIAARRARDLATAPHDPQWWMDNGGHGLLISTNGQAYDLLDDAQRAYLLGRGQLGGLGRERLYRAAAQIAFAIEEIDWSPFVGREGVRFEALTPAGAIIVRDGGNTLHNDDGRDVALLLDLGGNDTYTGPVAANTSGDNPVSVAIDLAGADQYKYIKASTRFDDIEGLLPADADGRYRTDQNYGPVSLSERARQGAARNGIAMLFDLGAEGDLYQSLRASQGYAHQGVGVLFDAGGDDTYLSEAASQGAAQFGIGLLVDVGQGDDARRAFTQSQGFGYVAGAGFIIDDGGDDAYVCDHGDPEHGGTRLYHSPQLPNNGNSSFCQGAGFGRRGASERWEHLSGGLGVLRDLDGDDTYEASVFGQGTGYWQGTGILSDGGGADAYDAFWYIQGGAAHYAVGILTDAGPGNDTFNALRPTRNVTLGSGHDYSLGILINDGPGDDTYHLTSLSAGASNCNGVGLFVDNGGDDTYEARSDYGSGMGNVSGECLEARPDAVSIGVMIDAGGADTYNYPESQFPLPGEGQTWGHARNGLASEFGAGLDAEGESGVHPESAAAQR